MRFTNRLLFLVLAPAVLLASNVKESCPLANQTVMSPQEQQFLAYHAASTNAELVAPSAANTGGRHRSITVPITPPLPAVNFVDSDLFSAMSAAGIVPTSISTDEEFLRRVTLDLTGQIPDATAVTAFLADKSPDKRTKKIDELLSSDPFIDRWTMWFGDLIQNVQVSANSREYYLGRNATYQWTKDSIQSRKPYDEMVRELISGKGPSFTNGPSNFWVRQMQPNGPIQDTYDNLATATGDKFLGMPLLCLSCHSGPGHLDLVNQYLKTKQRSDLWGMSAFFSRGRAAASKYTDPANPNATLTVYDIEDAIAGAYALNTTSGNKTPRQPAQGQPNQVQPAYLFTGEGPRTGEEWRDAYARILTADRQFARSTVNRLWKEMFGIAIVEPTDAFDLARLDPAKLSPGTTLQPTNPRLLEDLTSAFIANGYDLRSILRTMAVSTVYQLSSRYTTGTWNEAWTPYFARHYPHRLIAEEVLDAVAKATNVPLPLTAQGIGTVAHAIQMPDPTEPSSRSTLGNFLDEFGRGNRDDAARKSDGSITQALGMLNDTTVTTRVKKATANSTVAKVLTATTDPSQIVDQLYLATLSRYPTQQEKTTAVIYLKSGTLQIKAEDLQFTLMNQLEFLFD